MTFNWNKTIASLVLAFVTAGVAQVAQALEYGLSVGYEGEYTDNVRRDAEEEESDIIHRPYASALIQHLTPELEAEADYRVLRRMYQDDTYDGQTVTEGTGRLLWNVLPQRLAVFASNQRRESEVRTSGERVPENLQETDRSSVGATLSGNLISTHTASLTYEYIVINADETSIDSERDQVRGSYLIPLSSFSFLQLSAVGTDTDFDNPVAPDYRSTTGYAEVGRTTERTHGLVRVGYTSVDRELGRDTVDSVVGGLELSRTLADRSLVSFSYNHDVRDNSLDATSRFVDGDGDIVTGDTDLNEVYTSDAVALTYTTNLGINVLELGLNGVQEDYEDVARDTKRYGGHVRLTRTFRPQLSSYALASYQRNEFDDTDVTQDRYAATIGLNWDVGLRLTVGAFTTYFTREEEEPGGDIDEWRAGIRLDYLLAGTAR